MFQPFNFNNEKIMGHVYANLTLENSFDALLAIDGSIPPEDVRKIEVRALIDTGAMTLDHQ